MKKIIIFKCFILFSITSIGQQLKSYNGKYDLQSNEVQVLGINPSWINGTALYTYFEDADLNRIRSGKFNYNGNLKRNGASYSVSIIGNYAKNIKEGSWLVKQVLNVPSGNVSFNFNGYYKSGFPNGLWTSSQTITQNGKTVIGTYLLNFTNNIINGEFKMTTNDDSGDSILGSLDKNGYFSGKTIVKTKGDEYQFTFNNGILVSYIGRNLQSGNVFENNKINDEELAIFNKLILEKDVTLIEKIPFKIIDGYNEKINNLVIKKFLDIMKDTSLFDVIPGDLSIDPNKKYKWIGFKIRTLEKSEIKS